MEHPTVKAVRARPASLAVSTPIDATWLRKLCLDAGADDVGFVQLDRASLGDEQARIQRAFPRTRSLISFVLRMNRENVRSPARSVANNEFHHAGDEVNEVARSITAALERAGIRALNPPMAFPMEADRWGTDRMWEVAHKPVAVAAGLGRMGIHRNVIHPRFGNFILLGTVLLAAEISGYSQELDYNPCLILGDGADLREGFQDPVVKKPDEHFERFIAVLAPHVTLVLVLAKCAVVEGLQAAQEDIDQVVVQPIVLVRDKGYEMQVPFALGASGQLKDLGFDDAIGIVLNAVLAEGEMIQYRFEQSIAGFDQLQIGDPFFHFRRFGRLRELLHQGQFVGRIASCRRLVGAFLPQQGIGNARVSGVSSASTVLVKRRLC